MLERLHEHIVNELNTNTRTDTIFVVVAVIFNFVMLGISSGFAASASSEYSDNKTASLVILFINLVLSVLVNGIAVTGLTTGQATRHTLSQGLLKMYEDSQISQYYHVSLLANYKRRYTMFIGIIVLLGVASILIPLVLWLLGG